MDPSRRRTTSLLIAAAGRLLRQVKTLLDQTQVDRPREIEPPPDRARSREQFVRAEVEFGIQATSCRHVQLEKSIELSPPSLLRSGREEMGLARETVAVPVSPGSDVSGAAGEMATAAFPNGKSLPKGNPGSCVGSSNPGSGFGVGVASAE